MERDTQGKIALLAPLAAKRRPTRIGNAEPRSQVQQPRGNFAVDSPMKGIWGRINLDIATFLGAMETLSSDDSDANYQALLEATDRLLWGSARTRLELERIVGTSRRGSVVRRISG